MASFRILLFLMLVLGLPAGALGRGMDADDGGPAVFSSERVLFDSDWQFRWGDSARDATGGFVWAQEPWTASGWKQTPKPSFLPDRNGAEYVWLRVRVPTMKLPEAFLFIGLADQVFEAWKGSVLLYRFGDLNSAQGYRFLGYPWHALRLEGVKPGDVLSFRVRSRHVNIGLFGDIFLASSGEISTYLFQKGLTRGVIGSGLLLCALLAALVFFVSRRQKGILALFFMFLSCGLYIACTSQLRFHVLYAPVLWFHLESVAIGFCTASMAFAMHAVLRSRFMGYMALFAVLVTASGALVMWLGLVSVLAFLAFVQTMLLASGLVLLGLGGWHARRGDANTRILFFGVMCSNVFGLIDVVNALGLIDMEDRVAHFGLLLNMASVAVVVGRGFVESHRRLREYSQELAAASLELQKKNDELKRFDALKDEFLANTSHELRTPLNGIIGISESLLAEAAGPLHDEQRQNLNMIALSAKRLSHLVNDILDFSKLRHRELELDRRPVSVHGVAEAIVQLSRFLASGKKLEIRNEVPHSLPRVLADEKRLAQILQNLIGNAVKFTEKGSVTVSAAHLPDGEVVEIRVSDTGMGILPEVQGRIFEAFEQGDGSVTRKYGGTGLGLSITRKLVELHGGSIGVESEPGSGSVFFLTLPCARSEAGGEGMGSVSLFDDGEEGSASASRELAVHPRTPTSRTRGDVLIVDDEPVNLQVLENFLKLAGYAVHRADGAVDALRFISEEGTPDLVLLDVMMPLKSGYQVCQEIRERYSAAELPVILVTAKSQPEDLALGFQVGANDYVVKPVSQMELLSRVRTHLNLSRATRSLHTLLRATRDLSMTQDYAAAVAKAAAYSLGEWGQSRRLRVDCFLLKEPGSGAGQRIRFNLVPQGGKGVVGVPVTEAHLMCDLFSDQDTLTEVPVAGGSEAPMTLIEGSTLKVTLEHNGRLLGTVTLQASEPYESDAVDADFVEAVSSSLAIVLENLGSFQRILESELRLTHARYEELGRVAVRLGDRLNTPLQVICLSLEEIEDVLGSQELDVPYLRGEALDPMRKALERLSEEIRTLDRFKSFAPSDALEGEYDSPRLAK